jgi:hypothetical protein
MMVFVLTGAGLLALFAGLIAIVAGLPILEFSYGNTLITAGAIGASCGLVVIALAQILRELRRQAQTPLTLAAERTEFARPMTSAAEISKAAPPFAARTAPDAVSHDATSWRDAVPRQQIRRARNDDGRAEEPSAPARPTAPSPRNLMFRKPAHPPTASEVHEGSSSVRESSIDETTLAPAPQRVEGLWKHRRKGVGSTSETFPALDLTGNEISDATAPTVLKSGTVDGLAYTLYSDGSIEAQLEEGLVRFDSIEALRAHLDRPA